MGIENAKLDTAIKNAKFITAITCITVIMLSIIYSIAYYNVQQKKLMAQNVSEAVAKGVDPLSVRCFYAHAYDAVCIAYTASAKK